MRETMKDNERYLEPREIRRKKAWVGTGQKKKAVNILG